jgi:SAM-dependent methyltransferase
MNWKQKAAVQSWIARLPSGIGNPLYFFLQTRYGGLRNPSPVSRLDAAARLVRRIRETGRTVEFKTFLEVGTGHQLNLPLGLWLCGASRILTVDLNPYLKPKLVMQDLDYMRANRSKIEPLFADVPSLPSVPARLDALLACRSFKQVLALTRIEYLAPADATCLQLEAGSIDYHISFTVLEHVPPPVLRAIFLEARRVLKSQGLLVHFIDFTDHFAHSDQSISSVNFLQFDEAEWDRLAGNRYMYHNRLRFDEFHELIRGLDLNILSLEAQVDHRALEVMKSGFSLNSRFRTKDLNTNATQDAWLVAAPCA